MHPTLLTLLHNIGLVICICHANPILSGLFSTYALYPDTMTFGSTLNLPSLLQFENIGRLRLTLFFTFYSAFASYSAVISPI